MHHVRHSPAATTLAPGTQSDANVALVTLGGSQRARYHILIVDNSHSMTEADWPPCRLVAAIAACVAYIAYLIRSAPESFVAVICFSDRARVMCPWTSVAAFDDMDALQQQWLKSCYASGLGNTAIGEGLQEALILLQECKHPAQVVLLTDGHHNEGIDPEEVAPRVRALATVAVVGIGGTPADVDEPMLRKIASAEGPGRPAYQWVGDQTALVQHYRHLAGRVCRD